MTSSDRSGFIKISLLVTFCLAITVAYGQNRNLRKLAEQYFKSHRFFEAREVLETYCPTKPKDYEAWYWLAEAQFESNQCEEALFTLNYIQEDSKNDDQEVTLLVARTYHQLHQFASAIQYYKRFLANGIKDERYHLIVNEIKRCASGLQLNYISDEVLVENMGMDVNSRFDDFGPVESPNYQSRVYFSSTRTLRIQDLFGKEGKLIESIQGLDTDMFGTHIESGAWTKVEDLNPRLNTAQHEILQDFNQDGMVLFFSRSEKFDESPIWVDTFDTGAVDDAGSIWNDGPFLASEDIRGVYFFNDSIVFFSSDQRAGQGGYDLFYCKKNAEGWSSPVNLGDQINTHFDEVTPFLCADGRTLYFSSDRLNSMGGFDIFEARFNEKTNLWDTPKNLNRPLNSAGNDLFYRISSNGLMAFFSSDRKSGHGGHDIYSAYFKKPIVANLNSLTPLLFSEVRDFQLFNESLVDMQGLDQQNAEAPMAVFEMPYLHYRDDQIITPQNRPKLEKIVGFLQTYPHVSIEILCHSDQTAVSNFDLFFSIKRAEQIATFFKSKGIKTSSIFLKGFGGNYPVALNELDGKDNETGRFYNRRIDFRIHAPQQVPVTISYPLPEFMESLQDERLNTFYSQLEGLSYRIQFIVLDQLYKGDLIGKYPNSMIEKNPDTEAYSYCSGLYKNFNGALEHLSEIKAQGFTEARIIAYLNGRRLVNSQLDDNLIQAYPDLRNFMLYLH